MSALRALPCLMLIALTLPGCPQDGTGAASEYTGGEFQFTTVAVDDACLDGALEVLFMPEGPEVPRSWDYPAYLPSFGEMPTSYTIDLREPFGSIEVEVRDGGDGRMVAEDAVMNDVLLGEDRYGDCEVTMTCSVDLSVVNADRVEGTTAIAISDPRGDDGRCPVFDASPCTVTLTLQADRI
jgi:hypothetical protein